MTLMFDMNSLWESFVLHSLKKFAPDQYLIKGKIKKTFWEADASLKVGMEPDIVIECEDQTFILDTKWKVLNGNRPSDDDLKQMYVYTKYFDSSYTAMVYPDDSVDTIKGAFRNERDNTKNYPCSLIKLKLPLVVSNFTAWQKDICTELLTHLRS